MNYKIRCDIEILKGFKWPKSELLLVRTPIYSACRIDETAVFSFHSFVAIELTLLLLTTNVGT